MAGRLRDNPVVVGDAFAIEPASADASRFWVGRDQSGGKTALERRSFGNPTVEAWPVRVSFSTHGIHMLSPDTLVAGRPIVLPDVTQSPVSDFTLWNRMRPLRLRKAQRILAPTLTA